MNLAMDKLIDIIMVIPILLIALPFHEWAHAYVAYRLGDPTAKDAGRLTLNPFRHLDPFGTLMMLVANVGWARPVPVNSGYFRDRRKGMILVALAGPFSNLLLAFLFTVIWGLMVKLVVIGVIPVESEAAITVISWLQVFFRFCVLVNISLAVFNMIPVPPLDGSRLISSFIPEESYYRFARYEQYIGIAFLALVIFVPNALSSVIRLVADPIYESMLTVVSLVLRL
ncbi:MAG TPA: site-2 protease family protein [Thermoclostridium caenicola]|uniref:site-2 protease family protein n=1 Tax=Thermoclostridium caenicola TaxID=659425 RepID=UPI002B50F7B3|nr:site-2 protease family protein [Thermoclostridium caenicola]HOK43829.1 site-2 protease family protein [Thermoclostridium caenicola]HOL85325.1 site-2 protease family protein [Thermoclostridium caenicola]HOP71716.1 site-2 protease family protein [Thermoclostridium caenicola]HPO77147.1 site-2 protease family protein [Thermoclostridium caenicola]